MIKLIINLILNIFRDSIRHISNENMVKCIFKVSKVYVLLVSRDLNEYIIGNRSRVRIFLATMGRMAVILTIAKNIAGTCVKEVGILNIFLNLS